MKNTYTVLALIAALLLGCSEQAAAVDFAVKGAWQFGYGVNSRYLSVDNRLTGKKNYSDNFNARQRIRMQLDFNASANLGGSLWLELGHANYGQANHGMALGGDGTGIKVRNAYLDWTVPDTALKFRMGLQNTWLPSAAGGGMVLDNADGAGITATYRFNDTVALTGMWMRPSNDNFDGETRQGISDFQRNYLDNIDLFILSLPLEFRGATVTPWVMYGAQGKNAWRNGNTGVKSYWTDINAFYPLGTDPFGYSNSAFARLETDKAYGGMFWAGLPVKLSALDPWNIEFDLNYGWVEAMGRYDMSKRGESHALRASTERQGFIAKALVEYKMNWGTPGIFGWYGSGDDGNMKNGSERMPSISPFATFTSMLGDSTFYDGTMGTWDMALSYAGTWGMGFHLKDMRFIDKLTHTVRVAYRGGTNSPSMVEYAQSSLDWTAGQQNTDGPYLTTNDGLLEFNLQNKYKLYENLTFGLELGYIANMMDKGTWSRSWMRDAKASFSKQDAWKANVAIVYTF